MVNFKKRENENQIFRIKILKIEDKILLIKNSIDEIPLPNILQKCFGIS